MHFPDTRTKDVVSKQTNIPLKVKMKKILNKNRKTGNNKKHLQSDTGYLLKLTAYIINNGKKLDKVWKISP